MLQRKTFLIVILVNLKGKGTRKSGYNTYRGWTQTGYLNKHYNINQKTKTHRKTEEEMEGPISF